MASTIMKQTCVKCNKGAGIAMCNGCKQSFCIKHFIEHRQELSQEMENIGQEHDLLQRDLNYETTIHPLFVKIDQWEQESINIIKMNARNARNILQQLLDQTKNETKISIERFTEELRTCREANDYTEIDINKWTEQLKEFRQMIENPSTIKIDYDRNETSAIPLIKISRSQQPLLSSIQTKQFNENNNPIYEKFNDIYGNIRLSDDGLIAWCLRSNWDGSCTSGISHYSSKIHYIRFRIVQKSSNFLFFGIITASKELTQKITEAKSAYGWWDFNYTIFNGKTKDSNQTKNINTGDEVTLILNCDNQQIQFQHHQKNILVNIPIDLIQCPFPWKIVLRLDSEHDCIKILH